MAIEKLDALGAVGLGGQAGEACHSDQAAGQRAQHRHRRAGAGIAHPVAVFEPRAVLRVMQAALDTAAAPDYRAQTSEIRARGRQACRVEMMLGVLCFRLSLLKTPSALKMHDFRDRPTRAEMTLDDCKGHRKSMSFRLCGAKRSSMDRWFISSSFLLSSEPNQRILNPMVT